MSAVVLVNEEMAFVKKVAKVNEDGKEACVQKYQETLSKRWERKKSNETSAEEKKYMVCREVVYTCVGEVYSIGKVGYAHMREGNKW